MNIVEYMKEHHKGEKNQVSYNDLAYEYYMQTGYTIDPVSLRHKTNKAFKMVDDILISTSNGVFVAETKEEIDHCANRLMKHGLAEIVRAYKLRKLPLDNQMLIDLETGDIKRVYNAITDDDLNRMFEEENVNV